MKSIKNNNLRFEKQSIAELNDSELNDVNGGGTPLFSLLATLVVALTVADDANITVVYH